MLTSFQCACPVSVSVNEALLETNNGELISVMFSAICATFYSS